MQQCSNGLQAQKSASTLCTCNRDNTDTTEYPTLLLPSSPHCHSRDTHPARGFSFLSLSLSSENMENWYCLEPKCPAKVCILAFSTWIRNRFWKIIAQLPQLIVLRLIPLRGTGAYEPDFSQAKPSGSPRSSSTPRQHPAAKKNTAHGARLQPAQSRTFCTTQGPGHRTFCSTDLLLFSSFSLTR